MIRRNHAAVSRNIWVTEYEAQERGAQASDVTTRKVGELVGYYSLDRAERILNAQARLYYVEEVRHKLVPCTMGTIEFYNRAEKGKAHYEH